MRETHNDALTEAKAETLAARTPELLPHSAFRWLIRPALNTTHVRCVSMNRITIP
jgi:hypothetical protein